MKTIKYLIFTAAALCVGGGIGYGAALFKAGNNSVLLAPSGATKFTRIYSHMGRLAAAEVLAANCKSGSDVSSALANEADLIRGLRKAQDGTGSTSIADIAESRLAIRTTLLSTTPKDSKLQTEQEVGARKLLEAAGWRDSSAIHMQQIILALDKEHCQSPNASNVRIP